MKKSEAIIAEDEKKIAEARDKIRALEAEIRRLRDQADSLRARSNDLEIQVERLRTDITVAETKGERFEAQIEALQDRINIEEKKLATEELDDLNRMIDVLKRLVPTTEKEIDRHYYYCFGEGNVEVEQTGSVVVYIVRGESANGYLRNRYGANIPARNGGDLRLRSVDIFAAPWIDKFGYPLVNTQLGGDSLTINGSFGCLNPSAAVHGSGVITSIGADYIEAKDANGRRNKFYLSTCSRVESVRETPEIGQDFYYEAIPSSAGGFNLYGATCA